MIYAALYRKGDLEKTNHSYELPERDLNIDLTVHGMRGNDSWGAETLAKYSLPGNKPYYYGFIREFTGVTPSGEALTCNSWSG